MTAEGNSSDPVYMYTSPRLINQEKITNAEIELEKSESALRLLKSGHTGLDDEMLATMVTAAESRIASIKADILKLSTEDVIDEEPIDIKKQIATLKEGIVALKQVLFDLGQKEDDTATPPPEVLELLKEINGKEDELHKLENGVSHE